jgi:hypothetical protein
MSNIYNLHILLLGMEICNCYVIPSFVPLAATYIIDDRTLSRLPLDLRILSRFQLSVAYSCGCVDALRSLNTAAFVISLSLYATDYFGREASLAFERYGYGMSEN